MRIETVGVCGAGIMGAGIAQVVAQGGYSVILYDFVGGAADRGLEGIQSALSRLEGKGKLATGQAAEICSRIRSTDSIADLASAQFVIEAIVELINVKTALFRDLDNVLPPDAIIASNTSGQSIAELAAATRRPTQVIGTHFFNPAPVMKLVEIVRAFQTSEQTVELAQGFIRSLGKAAIDVKDAPLFAVNRILVPMLNEAIFVYQEGIATKEDIDQGMVLGCNHPIGPLALCDLVGLDTLLFVTETLQRETGDTKYRPAPLLRQMVRAGYLGRKSGKGFYDYPVLT